MNTKVTIPCRTIKAMAKEMMKGRYWKCVLVVLCCNLVVSAPEYIVSMFVENQFILTLVEVACYIAAVSLTLSMTRYFLMVFRGQNPNIDDLTDTFPLTWKAVGMEIISAVQIFLWSLLLIVPGIICAIKHAQNFNVMADNPDFSAMECIHKSHEIMEGNKWKYVLLTLSFIGWEILAHMPSAIYSSMFGPDFNTFVLDINMSVEALQSTFEQFLSSIESFNAQPIPMLLGLIPILVTTWESVSYACFYDLAAGNLVISSDAQAEENRGYIE